MARLDWDGGASLMRVTRFRAADSAEELVAHAPLAELVGRFLAMTPAEQDGLMIRQAGADWVEEHDADAIRELAARPDFTGAYGADDTALRPQDAEAEAEVGVAGEEGPWIDGGVTGPDDTDARGRDGEK